MKNRIDGGSGGVERSSSRSGKRREMRRRRSSGSSGRIALILAVVGLVLIVLFIVPRGQNKPTETLLRAGLVTGTPINSVDPTSGKPIVSGITSEYKGYTIGHCCAQSKGDWEALGASQKEAAIRRFLR